MIEKIKRLFQKKMVFTIVFLSAIFIQVTSVNALGNITSRHIIFHDNFFEYNENKLLVSYKQAYIHAKNYAENNLQDKNYIIFACNALEVCVVPFEENETLKGSMIWRWVNSANKEFTFVITSHTYTYWFKDIGLVRTSNSGDPQSNGNASYYNPLKQNPTTEQFSTNTDLNFPFICKGQCEIKFDGYANYSPFYFESLEYKDIVYNWGDNLEFFSVSGGENEEDIIYKQIHSVDFNLTNKDYTNNKFKVIINREIGIDRIRASEFQFYGLKNNNGLYNWEQINSFETGCAVDDYNESYTSNSYTFEVTGLTSACTGLFNTYEKVIFKIIYNNASEIDKISVSGADYYLNDYSDQHIIQKFNTKDFNYINFTTTLEEYSHFYDFNILPGDNIYLHLFNTQTREFSEYGVYTKEKENNHKYYLNIGQSLHTGFWLTYNIPIKPEDIAAFKDFDFKFAYVPDGLYYSITPRDGTRLNENAVIVDEAGNPIITDLIPTNDYIHVYYNFNILSDLFKYINKFMSDNNRLISEFSNLTNYFFLSLNTQIRNSLIAIYTIIILVSVMLNIRG